MHRKGARCGEAGSTAATEVSIERVSYWFVYKWQEWWSALGGTSHNRYHSDTSELFGRGVLGIALGLLVGLIGLLVMLLASGVLTGVTGHSLTNEIEIGIANNNSVPNASNSSSASEGAVGSPAFLFLGILAATGTLAAAVGSYSVYFGLVLVTVAVAVRVLGRVSEGRVVGSGILFGGTTSTGGALCAVYGTARVAGTAGAGIGDALGIVGIIVGVSLLPIGITTSLVVVGDAAMRRRKESLAALGVESDRRRGVGRWHRCAELGALRYATMLLPVQDRQRYAEEWIGESEVISLSWSRVRFVLSLIVSGVPRLAIALRWPLKRNT